MSNAAKFEVPDSGDNGKSYVYNSGSDSHVLTDMATQAELDAHASDSTSVHGITDTSALLTTSSGIDALSDVTITAAASGDILRHNGTAWVDAVGTTHFEAAGAVAAHEADTTSVHGITDTSALLTTSSGINALSDVTITSPTSGQVIKYNGSAWVNDTDSTAGGTSALDDLSDVTITAAASGDILRHNGTAWVDAVGTTHFEAAGAVAAHEADTTSVHGIADTSALVTTSTSLGGDLTGTVGNAQIAAGAVGATELASNAVTNDKVADDAIGIAELSATGTPSSSTFLRGDNSWATPSGGGSVATDSIFDAKGDLPVGTGADTAAKLTVGADHESLVAASSTSSGLRWESRVQAVPFLFVAGRYYMGAPAYDAATSAAFIADRALAHPFWLPRRVNIDRLAVAVITAVASSTLRLGIYLPDDTNGLPGTAVVNPTGSLDTSTTGLKEHSISSTAIPSGMLWAVVQTGSTGGAATRSFSLADRFTFGRAAGTDVNPATLLIATRSAADLPASLAGSSWTEATSNIPHGLQVRFA